MCVCRHVEAVCVCVDMWMQCACVYAYLYPPTHTTHTVACCGAKLFRIKLPTRTSNHVSSHKVITDLSITNVKLEL